MASDRKNFTDAYTDTYNAENIGKRGKPQEYIPLLLALNLVKQNDLHKFMDLYRIVVIDNNNLGDAHYFLYDLVSLELSDWLNIHEAYKKLELFNHINSNHINSEPTQQKHFKYEILTHLATLEQPERQKRVDRILCYKNLYETVSPQELWICLALRSSNPKPSYDPPIFPRDSGTKAIIRRENPLRSFGTWSRTHPRQALSVQLSHDGRIEDAVDYGGVSKEALAITFESLAHLDSFITDNGIISLKLLMSHFL